MIKKCEGLGLKKTFSLKTLFMLVVYTYIYADKNKNFALYLAVSV